MNSPFSLFYGPASATAPGYLTTSTQVIAGPKAIAVSGGSASAALTSYLLQSNYAQTNTSGTHAAFLGVNAATPGSSSSAVNVGMYGRTTTSGSQNFTSSVTSGGGAVAVYGTNVHAGSGVLTASVNFRAQGTTNTGGGTITNWVGFYAANETDATNNWAFYSETALSHFGGGATMGLRLDLKSYTVATLPAAGDAGGCIFVSDAAGNGPCIAVSNGTNWKRCDNVSTTVA